MKLIGPHSQKKKEGSNSNSSRTSPSNLVEDAEFVKNLLAPKNCDFDDEGKINFVSSTSIKYLLLLFGLINLEKLSSQLTQMHLMKFNGSKQIS